MKQYEITVEKERGKDGNEKEKPLFWKLELL